ncbi:diguanylate cyclase (GGDEF) domain-containing protein [Pseudomonas segetis]|uniref:diguanylate cyclase n=2 Tax=Pseudomonas segetis TaxID=298908 RepID=A0A239GVT4_9PSED|nr:diguanylate cyclase (GGDEF) domain-containing protein [Pseudomonas segetis]
MMESTRMPSFLSGVERDPLDTDFIRMNFRSFVQRGILIIMVVNPLHALVLWLNHSAWWQLSLMAMFIQLPFYPLCGQQRSFAVFLPSVLALFSMVAVYIWLFSEHFGSSAGFHYLIMSLIPLVIFAGRIGLRLKVLICLLMAIGMFMAELKLPGTTTNSMSTEALEQLRILNLLICFISISMLTFTHFVTVSRIQSKLQYLAAYDPLTQLVNRRRMGQLAEQEVLQSRRQQYPLSVILADVDNFKMINDRHGHPVGDVALQHVSELISAIARDTDSCCRWGGEEFLVLLPHTNLQGAIQVAERIRQQVAATPLNAHDLELEMQLTLGVAMLMPNEKLAELIKRADTALYEGKRASRNCVVKSDPQSS